MYCIQAKCWTGCVYLDTVDQLHGSVSRYRKSDDSRHAHAGEGILATWGPLHERAREACEDLGITAWPYFLRTEALDDARAEVEKAAHPGKKRDGLLGDWYEKLITAHFEARRFTVESWRRDGDFDEGIDLVCVGYE